jgi:Zn-dependent protease with chaperone function
LTVAGLCAPKVLVSEETLAALNPSELRAAIKHEIAHVRRYDNLKKMMFRVSPFPGMGKIEHVWAEQSELAADDAAVASRSDALDLASALIKVSKLATGQVPEVGAGLLHSSTALSVRVRRLFAWDENAISVKPSARWRYALTPAAVMVIWVCFSYGSILSRMHVLTEWLVR